MYVCVCVLCMRVCVCVCQIAASLMICYTHSGASAALIAKYRPPMPIMTLVVPSLVSNGERQGLVDTATDQPLIAIVNEHTGNGH